MSLYDKAKFILSGKAAAGSGGYAGTGTLYNLKPVEKLKAENLAKELVSDNWTTGTGISLSDGEAVFTDVVRYHRMSTQDNVFRSGRKYRVSFEVEDFVGERVESDSYSPNSPQTVAKLSVQQVDNLRIGHDIVKSGKYSFLYTAQDYTNDNGVTSTFTAMTFKITSGKVSCKIKNISLREVRSSSNDYSFSRNSDIAVTAVQSDGKIKKTTQNLLKYSNQFDQTGNSSTGWSLNVNNNGTLPTLTSGQAGYDGSTDAWLYDSPNEANNFCRIEQNPSYTGVFTFSIFAKKNTADYISFENGGIADDSIYFNLTDGTATGSGGYISFTADAVTGSSGQTDRWWRVSVTLKGTSNKMRVYASTSSSTVNSGTAGSIYIQHAQFERGMVPTPYIDTDGSDVPHIYGFDRTEPRFDYSGNKNGDGALLMEQHSRNLIKFSELIHTQGNWTAKNSTITSNATTSPEGKQNATKLQADSTNNNHQVDSDGFTYGPSSIAASIYAKKGSGANFVRLRLNGSSAQTRAWFDLQNGTVGDVDQTDPNAFGMIEDMGDGWYRCTVVEPGNTNTAGASLQIFINESDSQTSWDADGDEYIWIYGAQVENQKSPTSYIPTHGVQVTRNSDQATLRDIDAGTSYTMLFEFDATSNENTNTILMFLFDNNDHEQQSDAIFTPRWYASASENDSFRVYDQRGLAYMMGAFTSTNKKWVMRVDGTSFTLFRDNAGTPQKLQGSDLSGVRRLQKLTIRPNRNFYKNLVIFDSALTDAECESLIS